MRKSFLFKTNKQKKKEKRKQKYSIVNIIPMSIPANNNPNRLIRIIIGIRLINRDQGQARPGRRNLRGRRGWGCCTCIAQEHSPRSILNDTAQDSMVLVCTSRCRGDRDKEHGVRIESEREGEREVDERWSTTPKMGYLPLPTLCTMNPAFDSGSVDLLCPLAQPSVGTSFSSLSPGFCYGPRLRIIRLDRVAGLRDWAGHGFL